MIFLKIPYLEKTFCFVLVFFGGGGGEGGGGAE